MAKVGIISDTHDNCDALREAVKIFKEKGVEFIIHAGDVIAPFTARILEESGIEYRGVFGNNDGEKEFMKQVTSNKISTSILELELYGKKFFVIHNLAEVEGIQYANYYDYVIHGHTHIPEQKRVGKTFVLNPGELGGWLKGKKTYLILDTEENEVELREL